MAGAAVGAQDLQAWLATRTRWRAVEIAFWLACLTPYVLAPDYLQLASQIAIAALFALSLDLVLGYAGLISLGHAAFFGLGAYTAGLLAANGWGEPLSGLAAAAVFTGACGFLVSFVVVRFRGLALIMITLGLAQMLESAANSANWLTGGADGLQGVAMQPLFGAFSFDLWGRTAYAYSLAVLFLVFLLVRRITNSPFGLSLRGIRENESRMTALGASNRAHLRKAFTLAAAIAGMAGALLTQTTQTASLQTLGFQKSADVLVMLVLGGAGRLYGGLLGALVYMIARDQFSDVDPQYWYFWIGLLLIAVMTFLPGGILGGLSRLLERRRSRAK
ncbi:MAG TPA: branched-chain amino acid ABC transporter permease [Beijerinckiaceae bacterium]|nr:branched-chain amino acid ABC transporter permease [Beijerinckiaceae bacterium]